MDIGDLGFDLDRRSNGERSLRLFDQPGIEGTRKVVNRRFIAADGNLADRLRLLEDAGEVETLGLPVIDCRELVEIIALADELIEAVYAHFRHQLAHFLRDIEEVVDDMLRRALEALAQDRV